MSKKTTIGGQALIEGIMMKGPKRTVMAVRRTDGEIVTEEVHSSAPPKISKIPVLRGIVNYIITMKDGYKCLMRSADLSGFTEIEDAEEKRKSAEKRAKKAYKKALRKGADEQTAKDAAEDAKNQEQPDNNGAFMNVVMAVASVLGVALAFLLFMYVPSLIFDGINALANGGMTPLKSLIEGVMKIAVFVVYLVLVSQMSDIKRVFMYHGAEHKTIFCYEAGLELNVENVRQQKRLHPRCGTSFLIIMLVVGIIGSFILVTLFPELNDPDMRLVWVLIKLLSLPLICGFSYELIKICGRYDNTITRIISAPGMWLQKITTKEPEDKMIEVAIVAMKEVIPENSSEDDWK